MYVFFFKYITVRLAFVESKKKHVKKPILYKVKIDSYPKIVIFAFLSIYTDL